MLSYCVLCSCDALVCCACVLRLWRGSRRHSRQAYFACVSWTDSNVGKVLDAFDATPFAKDAVLAFWGTHMHFVSTTHTTKGGWRGLGCGFGYLQSGVNSEQRRIDSINKFYLL